MHESASSGAVRQGTGPRLAFLAVLDYSIPQEPQASLHPCPKLFINLLVAVVPPEGDPGINLQVAVAQPITDCTELYLVATTSATATAGATLWPLSLPS